MGEVMSFSGDSNPLIEEILFTLRDPETGMRAFDDSLQQLGRFLGYEIAKDLPRKEVSVRTLLGATATHQILAVEPVIVGIIRAGVPLMEGLHRAIPRSYRGFVAAARDEETLKATISYDGVTSLCGKVAIIADTMLATGGSLADTVDLLLAGPKKPQRTIVACAFAARRGIGFFQERHPEIDIYAAVIDPELNGKGYIVPGLGDAGDRLYGEKRAKR